MKRTSILITLMFAVGVGQDVPLAPLQLYRSSLLTAPRTKL
jgi:hypothetical protein